MQGGSSMDKALKTEKESKLLNEKKLSNALQQQLTDQNLTFTYDDEKKELRIHDNVMDKGMTLQLSKLVSKWKERKDKAIDEIVYTVEETFKAMKAKVDLQDNEKAIYPVIRATSFPKETAEGKALIYDEHTAETRIYYALDLGNTYQLIDEDILKKEGWDKEKIKEVSLFNLRSLKSPHKLDRVAGNDFYFINTKDGYDASRILNRQLLEQFSTTVEGDMAVAVPHQDVLILADIRNEKGYEILGEMAMHFFTNGRVPITVMPFLFENGEFEPIFVFASKRAKKE
jgi:uncharacterized protein YtpQ (UPF0354 family)